MRPVTFLYDGIRTIRNEGEKTDRRNVLYKKFHSTANAKLSE